MRVRLLKLGRPVLGLVWVAVAALAAPGPLVAAPAAEYVYVSNYSANTIAVYPREATGDVPPSRTIQSGVDHPHTMSVDLLHHELFVANNLYAYQLPAINVYDLDASFPGADLPKRTITGSLTGLTKPAGVLADVIHGELYVANDLDYGSSITVYPLDANGNVAPIRTLQGGATGIEGPIGMAVDQVHDELIVVSYKVPDGGSISFFPRTASGNAPPLRVIQGPDTGLNDPQGVGLDLVHDEVVVANSAFLSTGLGNILVFARSEYGDASPIRQIGGPTSQLCNPIDIVLDLVNDEITVANSHFGTAICSQSVTTYARTASGDAAPLRMIGPGPNSALNHPTGVVTTTRVDCSDPSVAEGTPCDDGNGCTQTDTCHAGVCVGSDPVICSAPDACHDAGTCDPASGVCSHPAKADGTVCDDGNGCTQTDTCEAGVCTGANPVTCAVPDQCHDAGVCDTATGTCSAPTPKADGTTCNDGNACTQTDTCESGVCTGANPVTCTAPDQCHDPGTCDTATGVCSAPTPKPNGTACNDGNACTQTDTCEAGVCTGANPVTCTAPDQCHDAGTCDTATGVCSAPTPKPNGTTCNDGNACTQTDTCESGVCTGANPVTCTAPDQCHDAGVCDTATGVCSAPTPKPNGTSCNDGNACTQTDTCEAGVCTGANPVTCTAPDQCHDAGVCDTATGVCSAATPKPNGTTCNDGNACTQTDTCEAGVCTGANPVTCTAPDQCHDPGTCDTATGVCSAPTPKPNGTTCNDGNACTQTDTCEAGVCTGANPVTCTASDQCHDAGVCDSATGVCSNPPKPDGTTCNDASVCTVGDACLAGACVGGSSLSCDDGDPCTIDTCDAATGCSHAFQDTDGDGVCDAQDCAPADPGAFAKPGELTGLLFGADKVTLTWNSGAPTAGPGTVSDLLRGTIADLPVGSHATEQCVDSALPGTSATDSALPAPDGGWWYLVRGSNACGAGPYGFKSDGTENTSPACP